MSSIQKKVKFFFSLLIFQFVIRSVADEFTDPRDDSVDLVYERGSLTQLAWNSDLSRVALLLWSDSGEFERLPNSPASDNITNVGSYPWVVQTTKDISSNRFNFGLYFPGSGTAAFFSNHFRITDNTSAASTTRAISSITISTAVTITSSTSSSSAATTSSIADPSRSLNPTPPVTPNPSAIPAAKSGLSRGQKDGIGIGIGIGVPLLVAMGVLVGWKFRERRTRFENSRTRSSNINVDLPTMTNAQPTNRQELPELTPNEILSGSSIREQLPQH